MKHHHDLGTGKSNSIQHGIGEDIVDTAALTTSIFDDWGTSSRMRTLFWGTRMPIRALQPLRMKKGDQPRVTAILVQQVVEWETDRSRHRGCSENSGIFQRLPRPALELQPEGYMSHHPFQGARCAQEQPLARPHPPLPCAPSPDGERGLRSPTSGKPLEKRGESPSPRRERGGAAARGEVTQPP